MSAPLDVLGVLDGLRNNEEFFNEHLAGHLRSSPTEPYYKYSSSLENQRVLPFTHSVRSMERTKEAGVQAQPVTMKSVSFTKPPQPGTSSFTFAKEPIRPRPPSDARSGLYLILQGRPAHRRDQVQDVPDPQRHAKKAARGPLKVKVFLDTHLGIYMPTLDTDASGKAKQHSVVVPVDRTATVENVIETVLQHLHADIEKMATNKGPPSSPAPQLNARKYQLLLAEDDGSADLDYPVLQKDQEIARFGASMFVLCKDPDYAPNGNGDLANSPTIYSTILRNTLKVYLPSKEHHLLQYQPELSLREVLVKVCRKRMIDPDLFTFVSQRHAELDMDQRVENLGDIQLHMVMKSSGLMRSVTAVLKPLTNAHRRGTSSSESPHLSSHGGQASDPRLDRREGLTASGGIDRANPPGTTATVSGRTITINTGGTASGFALTTSASASSDLLLDSQGAPQLIHSKVSQKLGLPSQFFFPPSSASEYVQYPVIKTNKYGKRQERIMGIDGERITNSHPSSAKPGSRTRRPSRALQDVVKVSLAPNKGSAYHLGLTRQFFVEYKDSTQVFESDKAEEIVARINFIMSTKKNKGKEL
eukprot:TRINITY_DN255_c0_g1_i3.p1 TRINITY_DN255_c0_g1~~TRINITY_DN255_c0_g1_i3.p1  ORF type:complete len:588 (-),score=140.52 TRINITY_DN255_c0_g1_i3:629-2392(-)